MAPSKTTPNYSYYANGQLIRLPFATRASGASATYRRSSHAARRGFTASKAVPKAQMLYAVQQTMRSQRKRLCGSFPRFHDLSEGSALTAATLSGSMVVPTETMIIETRSATDVNWARRRYGMELVQEGRHGKLLLAAPEGGTTGVQMVFDAARTAHQRSSVASAQPNFLRAIDRPAPARAGRSNTWNLDNNGQPGLPGADVHAEAAWTISQGEAQVRVAILDEGVDSLHPHLRDVIVAEGDFVDANDHARPDGNDAHGTACAGIVASQHSSIGGLAPGVSLVSARIAKSDAQGYWIFDDFDTADAIDWCWDEAEADVLSNSWGGGPASDAIIRAFTRATNLGRRGKGAVVVIAAGNSGIPVDFPGDLPNVLTVGASNQWDERKTRTSLDKENFWASNFGPGLDLMAPGVKIPTTDIRGARGYSSTLFTNNFNGTSSACPHVAAAAALILSVNPGLQESEVRQLIASTADNIGGGNAWNPETGHGRLNAYRALWAARRV